MAIAIIEGFFRLLTWGGNHPVETICGVVALGLALCAVAVWRENI